MKVELSIPRCRRRKKHQYQGVLPFSGLPVSHNLLVKMNFKNYEELEDRLVDFSAQIMDLAEVLPKTYAGRYISEQVTRCGTAPSLLYAEAQGAESPADFLHKLRVALKELREARTCQKLIRRKGWRTDEQLAHSFDENNQLISIFVASIKTAMRNNGQDMKPKRNG
jgi:four helix bundle protein